MTNILVIYDRVEPSVELAKAFLSEFKKIYNCEIVFVLANEVAIDELNASDVLIEIRPQSMFLARLAKMVRVSGRISVAIYDDDFLAIKDFHVRRRIQEKSIISVLKNINVLMSANDKLLAKYERIGDVPRCVKMDTAVSNQEIKKIMVPDKESLDSDSDIGKQKIIYYCNDGSVEAFEMVIGTMLPQIISAIGDNIIWNFIGTKPRIDASISNENVNYIDHLSLEEFKEELKNGEYSYGIAPLINNEFSSHKYINKFIEFTTAGIPCIYSNVSPYKDFIKNGVDGFLCDNEQSWIDAMKAMRNSDTRYQIVKNAQLKLMEEFSIESIAERVVGVIPEMSGELEIKHKYPIKKSELIFAKIEMIVYKYIDILFKAYGRIKTEGFYSFIRYSITLCVRKAVRTSQKFCGKK